MKKFIIKSCASFVFFAGICHATAQSLTNIIIAPANSVIAAGSNQTFIATGQFSGGSSSILTNAAGAWQEVAGMPSALYGPCGAAVNGMFYVEGGTAGSGALSQVFVYNPASNAWSNGVPFPNPACALSGAAAIGDNLYIVGGAINSDANNPSSLLSVFNTVSNVWSNAAPMSTARSQMGVAVMDGELYAVGGTVQSAYGPSAELSLLEVYNPATNGWTTLSPMPTARSGCGAAAIDGKLYVVGGYNGTGPVGTLEIYDTTSNTWTTGPSMPTPRSGLNVAVVDGLLYAIDGNNNLYNTNLVEIYNPITESWSTGSPTLTAHTGDACAEINGTIYLAGGPNPPLTTAEAFVPLKSTLSWSSSDPRVASIKNNGVATGVTNGITTITALSFGTSASTLMTVVVTPAISTQPVNTTAAPDGSVTLSVSAMGGDLTYQWQLDGTNITDATGSTLTITNITPANVGIYTVVITNPAGSVTSQPAIVGTTAIQMFAGVVVYGPLGANYQIQATSNLSSGSWTTLTNLALPSQPYIYIDYNSPANPQQFYRAVPQ